MAAAGQVNQQGTAAFDREAIRAIPKVELHRHLEGALPPEFFLEMAKEFSIELPSGGAEGLKSAITMAGQEKGLMGFDDRGER